MTRLGPKARATGTVRFEMEIFRFLMKRPNSFLNLMLTPCSLAKRNKTTHLPHLSFVFYL